MISDVELLEKIYAELEPMTESGGVPMHDRDIASYRMSICLQEELQDHLSWHWGLTHPAPPAEQEARPHNAPSLPQSRDLEGIDITGGVDPTEYIRRLRE